MSVLALCKVTERFSYINYTTFLDICKKFFAFSDIMKLNLNW